MRALLSDMDVSLAMAIARARLLSKAAMLRFGVFRRNVTVEYPQGVPVSKKQRKRKLARAARKARRKAHTKPTRQRRRHSW